MSSWAPCILLQGSDQDGFSSRTGLPGSWAETLLVHAALTGEERSLRERVSSDSTGKGMSERGTEWPRARAPKSAVEAEGNMELCFLPHIHFSLSAHAGGPFPMPSSTQHPHTQSTFVISPTFQEQWVGLLLPCTFPRRHYLKDPRLDGPSAS